jgi:DNA-binding GntR family transcriptional regulator
MLVCVLERLLYKREFGGFYIGRGLSAFEEHTAILQALCARDRDKAISEMRAHVRRGEASLLAQIDQLEKGLQALIGVQGQVATPRKRRGAD